MNTARDPTLQRRLSKIHNDLKRHECMPTVCPIMDALKQAAQTAIDRLQERKDAGLRKDHQRSVWLIWVAGYGAYEFIGTEAQAEESRAHKANWEKGIGKKFNLNFSPGADEKDGPR